MIFIGDISLGALEGLPELINLPADFKKDYVIGNLEGQIIDDSLAHVLLNKSLYSAVGAFDRFHEQVNLKAVLLANNHIFDLGPDLQKTKEKLISSNILFTGAGNNIDDSKKEIAFTNEGVDYVLLSFGWEVVGCKNAEKNIYGVNPLDSTNIIKQISEIKSRYANHLMIVCFHWGVELDQYPQPYSVGLAHRCIDTGVDLIIGTHPHCVQGFEVYNSKYIFYSLGNFILRENYFLNKKLRYPGYCNIQICVKASPRLDEFKVYFFINNAFLNKVKFVGSFSPQSSDYLVELSKGFGEKYDAFYRVNKRKTLFLPTLFLNDSNATIYVKKKIIKLRGLFIALLLRFKLKRLT